MMIYFFNDDFNKVTLTANQRHILALDLDEDNSFDEDDPDTIIHVRLLAWCNKFEKHKAL